jgi:uncharacterized membrane protein YkvA (DUF1232 family)
VNPPSSVASVADRGRRAATRVARRAAGPRRGARRTVLHTLAQLPHYARLLAGLMTDRRVSRLDRALVGIALAYLLLPLDFIPDALPFLGQVDDVFLVMTALQRLVDHAGRAVLRDHWTGSRADLRRLDVAAVVSAAAFFLPGRMKRNLRGLLR